MSFLDRIRECAQFRPADYLPVHVDGQPVGLIRPDDAASLREFPQAFAVDAGGVRLAAGVPAPADRTKLVNAALRVLAERKQLLGWRDEPYPVAADDGRAVLLHMDRAAVPRFGIRASGVHLNGYVRRGGEVLMWVGRRSLDKHTAPGKLDQIVAGGRSAGLSVRETLHKEGMEEAAIPEALAGQARPTGAILYCTQREEGLRRDVLYIYDLELPPEFIPENHDGEIAEFQLWPIGRVLEAVRDTDDFKFNCALVVIDFLIRHGYLDPDDADYPSIVAGLRFDPTFRPTPRDPAGGRPDV
jgi:hypothetical protein